MAECLDEIASLVEDAEIAARDRALRLEQYAVCASGGYCAEVAFDPTAQRLRAIASRLGSPAAAPLRRTWDARVRDAFARLVFVAAPPVVANSRFQETP